MAAPTTSLHLVDDEHRPAPPAPPAAPRRGNHPGIVPWSVAVVGSLIVILLGTIGPFGDTLVIAPRTLAISVTIAASLCAVGAMWVIAAAYREGVAELGLLGTFLWSVSILPLVHGLTTPGVLYGPNNVTGLAVFLALPCGLAAGLPVILPGTRLGRFLARAWQAWAMGWIAITTGLAGAMLVAPALWPAPPTNPIAVGTVIAVALLGTFSLSLRHLRLFAVGGRHASLIASIGFASIGLSGLVWLADGPYTIGWWFAHVLDVLGVFGGIFGLVAASRRERSINDILAPVLARDPIAALELGLAEPVHAFVADLEAKDPITRDHVVRVGELAMRIGARAGLDGARLRRLGVAALLHDIGKLRVPSEILTKPSGLTDDEYEVIKRHTIDGEEMLAGYAALAGSAPFVRWHHERPDGTGYPDALVDAHIPLEAGIISVCDAWDAMTNTRQYREGMAHERAGRILAEHAGTQFDARVVALLAEEIAVNGPVDLDRLAGVGRRSGDAVTAMGPNAHVCDTIPLPA